MTWLEESKLYKEKLKNLYSFEEKIYDYGNSLTYEEARSVCNSVESFKKYIIKNKDKYFTQGEFNSSEFPFARGFIFKNKYSDYYEVVENTINKLLYEIAEDPEVEIYRSVGADNFSQLDWKHLGNCWCYDQDACKQFAKYWIENKENLYMFEATTDRDNIDWILSICLNLNNEEECELRVYDESKIDCDYAYEYNKEDEEWY